MCADRNVPSWATWATWATWGPMDGLQAGHRTQDGHAACNFDTTRIAVDMAADECLQIQPWAD